MLQIVIVESFLLNFNKLIDIFLLIFVLLKTYQLEEWTLNLQQYSLCKLEKSFLQYQGFLATQGDVLGIVEEKMQDWMVWIVLIGDLGVQLQDIENLVLVDFGVYQDL